MASRIVVKRFTSQLPKWDSLLHEQVKTSAPARAFTATAAKAQGDADVDVRRTAAKEQAPEVSAQNRGWPRSLFPGLLSPFYQPTSLTQMMDTMDRFFDFPMLSGPQSLMRNTTSRVPWDVMEDEKGFKLRVDMPGVSKEDVKLCVEDGDLVMKAENDAEKKQDDWSSRSYGSFNVRIKLPENVDASGIKAEMKDGVLKVVAPKVEGAKQKREVQIE